MIKGRLHLLPCGSLLHIYYPNSSSKRCASCNHPADTVSHSLNGCSKFKNMIQERHNRIVNIIYDKLKGMKKENTIVLKDSLVTPERFLHEDMSSFENLCNRPDLCMIDHTNKKAFLIEISVPFDAFINQNYNTKFDKYFPLTLEINKLGYHCQVIVLSVGSLGTVHKKSVSGLTIVGLNKFECRFLAKYISISAGIGSHRIWKMKCKDNRI